MKKVTNEPQGKRSENSPFGYLKNNNPPCDLRSLPRCQAKAKSTGKRCGNPAMKGKRVCHIHGGKSTGPKTQEGLERSKRANWKHGNYSAEMIANRKHINNLFKEARKLLTEIR